MPRIAGANGRYARRAADRSRQVYGCGGKLGLPVVSLDGRTIANGHPGVTAQKIRAVFFAVAKKTAI